MWGWNLPKLLAKLYLPAPTYTPSLPSGPRGHSPEEWGGLPGDPEPEPVYSPQFHAAPAGRGCSGSRDTQGFLCGQNTGLGLPLGTEEADLSPLPILPPAIL